MFMKSGMLILAIAGATVQLTDAIPPLPPEGKRWVRNERFSDEFNGNALDSSKWFDHFPGWTGRPPGIFLASQVSVGSGLMKIQSKKLDEDRKIGSDIYHIAGGAVVSRTTDASFGYYECRFKAAATPMSTTFWLSSRREFDGPKGRGDSYGLELDIQECIGREGDFPGKDFAKGMHSNAHFWYRETGGGLEPRDLQSHHVVFDSDALCSAAFNTYGGWWRDESNASFYFNNGEPKHMEFDTDVKKKPFDQTMGLNMVSETYPTPWIELPGDRELNDESHNTCYYDWVRSYVLVDAEKAITQEESTGGKPIMLYQEDIHLGVGITGGRAAEVMRVPISYKANEDRKLRIELLDGNGAVIGEATHDAYAGYANLVRELKLKHAPSTGSCRLKVILFDTQRKELAVNELPISLSGP